MTRALIGLSMMIWATLALGGAAWADIPPPEVEDCRGKAPNDSCGDGGRCQDATCSRATPDGSVDYACFKCVPSNPDAPTASGGACGAGGGAGGALALGLGALGLGVGFARKRA